ncbi:acetylajmalan esterase-like [Hordeum vulgare]|uniref:Predicted protein n=1 Tax=Hordeum vulgare subsp. vulgare TaxID=112509 RepID=F2EHS4_HORVV|nr:GDSL esterase/lipase At5g45910-like [Hordeum vulgare subsp. vulgare]KAE8818079.1 acetylajmalan esterase-like [Hordeum vulgare]BAK06896.1 predicted protein [Hordeum vulgare subsp. vulgare]
MALALGRRLHLLMVLLLAGTCVAPPPPQFSPSEATVDGVMAIYNFGDSISDTGSLLREGDTGMLRYTTRLPYGVTIGRPTGRCSDGFLMIDVLAKDLGLPLLNPYLDRRADFTHGVNFAVAGATALSTTALANRGISVPHTNSSLGVQLGWFKQFMSSTTNSPRDIRKKLASSLVMLGEIGGNDYNYVFLQPRRTSDRYDPISNATRSAESLARALSLVPEVVQTIAGAAKEVLDMGATRVVIPGNFPIGCMPSYLSAATASNPASLRDSYGCLVSFNLLARAHNERLQRAVAELRRSYPDATVAYADYFAAYLEILGHAPRFGFEGGAALRRACCGAGGGAYNFESNRLCGAPGTTACADPSGRPSWDGIHLTQHGYRIMAELLYRRGLACPVAVKLPGQKPCPPVS